ncbi:MAG: hypothetical protein ABWY78_04895 [Microvirga sp.]
MGDIAGFWADARSWFVPAAETLRAQPVYIALLLVPLVASLLCRSLTALLIGVLAAGIGLLALRSDSGIAFDWSVLLAAGCTGLLAALLAFFKRSAEARARAAEKRLLDAQQELEIVRGKHEREVQWRQAGDRLSGRASDAVPS